MQEVQRIVFGLLKSIWDFLTGILRAIGGTSMLKFLIRRLLAAIPVLLAILLVTFTLSHLLPGGPFNAVGQRRMPDYVKEQLEQQFGLDKPLIFNTWNDGKCPEAEDQMEAAGCYDEYNKDLARHADYQAYLVGVDHYQEYEDIKAQYEQYQAHQAALTEYEAAEAEYVAAVEKYNAALSLQGVGAEVDQLEVQMNEAGERLVAASMALDQFDADAMQDYAATKLTEHQQYLVEAEESLAEYDAAVERLNELQSTLAQVRTSGSFKEEERIPKLQEGVNEAKAEVKALAIEAPEEPAEPEFVIEEEPKRPKSWSLLPITRYETLTESGGDATATTRNTVKVTRIDLLDSQFFNYMWDAMHMDFGPSLNVSNRTRNIQVSEEISERLPVSLQVGLFAVALGFLLGVPLGVLAAVYHNSAIDYVAMFFAVMGQSTPSIVLAPILIIIFAVELGWVPVAATDNAWREGPELSSYYIKIMALPVITLGTGMSAGIARLTRASLLQVLHEDYVRTARAKGLRERVVVYVHALKNAMIPVTTILGPLLAAVLTGTFVVELIFVIPGLGKVFVESVAARDYTMIMGVSLLYSVFLILGNILVDIMYTWLDPRIRFD